MIVSCTKPESAIRQLDTAIDLLFEDVDPLPIRTLASAAHGVLADLMDKMNPRKSWRSQIIESSGLTKRDALKIINNAQNFLKHADRDPEANLSFDEEENDHIIFMATLECGTLSRALSLRMQAFQIWYLAVYPTHLGHRAKPVVKAKRKFPFIAKLSRRQKLACGGAFIKELVDQISVAAK